MPNLIACRTGIYHGAENPYELLADAGVAGAEVDVPSNGDYQGIKKMADAAGVPVTSLSTGVALADDTSIEKLRKVIESAKSIDVPIVFVSVSSGDMERTVLLDRWRRLGDVAADHGVTLSAETHEPFAHNGDVASATMKELNHPNIRMNFDTANIYYYNRDIDTVVELKKEIEYVASVHLKDTMGLYHDGNFPVLGQGVVDFPEVFRLLGEREFTGPYTMELEGPLSSGKTLEERHASVKACMEYLRSIGAC